MKSYTTRQDLMTYLVYFFIQSNRIPNINGGNNYLKTAQATNRGIECKCMEVKKRPEQVNQNKFFPPPAEKFQCNNETAVIVFHEVKPRSGLDLTA